MENLDPEKQKLIKVYIDLVQKQDVFDEVIKIIEEEGLDVENLFLAAFEKLCIEEDDEQSQISQQISEKSKTSKKSQRKILKLNNSSEMSQSIYSSSFGSSPNLIASLSEKSLLNQQDFGGEKQEYMSNLQGQLKLNLGDLKVKAFLVYF